LEIRSNIHFRACDRELTRRHLKFFPITLGPMRKLTARGIKLAAILRADGNLVFEGYPGASQDILKIPRKGAGVMALAVGLRSLGLPVEDSTTHDELDAITCAYVGLLYLKGGSELIGDEAEGQILIPRAPKRVSSN
jgi:predicted nuclease with RNAse H fold